MLRTMVSGLAFAGHAARLAVALAGVFAWPLAAAADTDAAAQALIDRLTPGFIASGMRLPPAPPGLAATPALARPSGALAAPWRTIAAAPRPPLPARATEIAEAAGPMVAISVTFATASALLTPDGERLLAPLGQALASDALAPYRFRIEGHTDSVGDAVLNQALSERRAAAVRDHLVHSFGVAANRLIAVGFGASQPDVPTPPQTSEARNRRVQVVNLGH